MTGPIKMLLVPVTLGSEWEEGGKQNLKVWLTVAWHDFSSLLSKELSFLDCGWDLDCLAVL